MQALKCYFLPSNKQTCSVEISSKLTSAIVLRRGTARGLLKVCVSLMRKYSIISIKDAGVFVFPAPESDFVCAVLSMYNVGVIEHNTVPRRVHKYLVSGQSEILLEGRTGITEKWQFVR